jgi:hypothetical protein
LLPEYEPKRFSTDVRVELSTIHQPALLKDKPTLSSLIRFSWRLVTAVTWDVHTDLEIKHDPTHCEVDLHIIARLRLPPTFCWALLQNGHKVFKITLITERTSSVDFVYLYADLQLVNILPTFGSFSS